MGRCAVCREAPATRSVVYFPRDRLLREVLVAVHEDSENVEDQFPTWPVAYTCPDCLLAVNSLTAPPQPDFGEAVKMTSEEWGERLRTCVSRQVWA
jgi:hypothetical protein